MGARAEQGSPPPNPTARASRSDVDDSANSYGGAGRSATSPRLAHVGALDGLRGVAIVGMLLYHAGLVHGSWLSLSTFFTLSGFLITGLVAAELHTSAVELGGDDTGRGRLDLGRFWARRGRRLIPGALVALVAISVLSWWAGWVTTSTRGDLLAATFWSANWHFVVSDRSYAELFTDPSPVQHFWSLAVEEQFYLLFPVVVFLAARRGRRTLTAALAAMCVLSVAATLWISSAPGSQFDRVYYGTDTRAAEFAVGGLLALALWRGPGRRDPITVSPTSDPLVLLGAAATEPSREDFEVGDARAAGAEGDARQRVIRKGVRETPPRHPSPWSPRREPDAPWRSPALFALVVGAWLWLNVGTDASLVTQGGLALYAVSVSAVVIAASTIAGGATARLLSPRPLRWTGRISYGLYLYHWPVFLLLTTEAVGLAEWPLFALRVTVTVGIALLSKHLVERPIRSGVALGRGRVALRALGAGVALTVLVIGLTTIDPNPPVTDFAGAVQAAEDECVDDGRDGGSPDGGATGGSGDGAGPGDAGDAGDGGGAVAGSSAGGGSEAGGGARGGRPDGPRFVLLGDSTAVASWIGLGELAAPPGGLRCVGHSAALGCALAYGGSRRSGPWEGEYPEACPRWDREWAATAERTQPDVALVLVGSWDLYDRTIPGIEGWHHFGEPEFDEWYAGHLGGAMDSLAEHAGKVVWCTVPPSLAPDGGDPVALRGQAAEPARVERLNELIRAAAAERPTTVQLCEWAEWLESGGRDSWMRPDGVHLSTESSPDAAPWLSDQIHRAWSG